MAEDRLDFSCSCLSWRCSVLPSLLPSTLSSASDHRLRSQSQEFLFHLLYRFHPSLPGHCCFRLCLRTEPSPSTPLPLMQGCVFCDSMISEQDAIYGSVAPKMMMMRKRKRFGKTPHHHQLRLLRLLLLHSSDHRCQDVGAPLPVCLLVVSILFRGFH